MVYLFYEALSTRLLAIFIRGVGEGQKVLFIQADPANSSEAPALLKRKPPKASFLQWTLEIREEWLRVSCVYIRR